MMGARLGRPSSPVPLHVRSRGIQAMRVGGPVLALSVIVLGLCGTTSARADSVIWRHGATTIRESDDLASAIAKLTSAIQHDASDADVYLARGFFYKGGRQLDRAIADFSAAILLKPRLDAAYLARGDAFAKIGDVAKAIADLTAAIKINPGRVDAFLVRAAVYAGLDEADLAELDITQARRLGQRSVEALSGIGDLLSGLDKTAEAIEAYSQAIAIAPGDRYVRLKRGRLLMASGQDDRAISDFSAALQDSFKGKDDVSASIFQAFLNVIKGDPGRAASDLPVIGRSQPSVEQVYLARGQAYWAKRDADRALADYDQALRLKPNDGEALFNRAIVLRARGDTTGALADLATALQLDPDEPAIYRLRANIDLQLRDNDLAVLDYSEDPARPGLSRRFLGSRVGLETSGEPGWRNRR